MNSDLLALPVSSTTEALALFGDRLARFKSAYQTAIDNALALGRATTTCTIYNGNIEPQQASLA